MGYFNYPDAEGQRSGAQVEDSDSVLANLSTRDWRRLLNFAERIDFNAGDILVNAGERDDSVYVLVEGEVEVIVKRRLLGDKVLAVIPAGSVFGEMAFFDHKPRSATIRSISRGRALCVESAGFERICVEEPDLAQKLLFGFGKVLSLRNRQMSALMSN